MMDDSLSKCMYFVQSVHYKYNTRRRRRLLPTRNSTLQSEKWMIVFAWQHRV